MVLYRNSISLLSTAVEWKMAMWTPCHEDGPVRDWGVKWLTNTTPLSFGYTQWRLGELQPNTLTSTPVKCWQNDPNQQQTKGLTVCSSYLPLSWLVTRPREGVSQTDFCVCLKTLFCCIFNKCPWPSFRGDSLSTDLCLIAIPPHPKCRPVTLPYTG